jgi:hypothetical protein
LSLFRWTTFYSFMTKKCKFYSIFLEQQFDCKLQKDI